MRPTFLAVCAAAAIGAGSLVTVQAQQPTQQAPSATAPPAVFATPVQGAITMVTAGGLNVAVQVGKNGVVLVDTPPEALVPQFLAEVRKLSDRPVLRYIINTSQATTIGNAALVGPAGSRGLPFAFVGLGRPSIIAHENVLNRMSNAQPAVPGAALPTTEYFQPSMDMFANDEPIMIYHQPKAHSDGDSVVLFRKSDVVVAGNVFTPGRYPVIDVDKGGSVDGLVKALGTILSLAVPEAFENGGTRIIPARGRIAEETDVAEFRDMVVIVRNRVEDAMKKKMTLDQVKASRPSRDYDAEYGASQADADRFVETIYRTLTPPAPPAPARPAGRQGTRPAAGGTK